METHIASSKFNTHFVLLYFVVAVGLSPLWANFFFPDRKRQRQKTERGKDTTAWKLCPVQWRTGFNLGRMNGKAETFPGKLGYLLC